MSPERVSVEEEGEGHSRSRKVVDQKQKRRGNNSRESHARNLEDESIRNRTESMGRCVKLKTVTEIRRSSARDTFIAESACLSCTEFRVGLGASGKIETEV